MTKEQLNQKEQHYAGSFKEAEEIVVAAKESIYLMMQKITEKHNKLGTYFLVDLTYSYNVPRDIMENEPDSESEQGEQHEGIKMIDDGSGGIYVDPNQTSIDDFVEGESVDTGAEEEPVELDTSNNDVPF